MKKVTIFFNSPYLGGAERSMIHQIKLVSDIVKVDIVIPFLKSEEESKELIDFIIESGIVINKIRHFNYSKKLFSLSRDNIYRGVFGAFFGYFETAFLGLNSIKNNVSSNNLIWLNGNKIAIVVLFWLALNRFSGSVVWHFRDYVSNVKKLNLFLKVLNIFKKYKLTLLGNSISVKDSLKPVKGVDKIDFIYNPVGKLQIEEGLNSRSFSIASVSMLAPWKGIHQLVIMVSMYEEQLKNIGIQKIKIYGGSIYKTKGSHFGYEEQLKKLVTKLDCENIEFCGNVSPEKIYGDTDLMLHLSNREEPFGRVITEAFLSKLPVVSSGLGGAEELVGKNEERGQIFYLNDPLSLLNAIKNAIHKKSIVEDAYHYAVELEVEVKNKLKKLLREL